MPRPCEAHRLRELSELRSIPALGTEPPRMMKERAEAVTYASMAAYAAFERPVLGVKLPIMCSDVQ